MKKILFGAAVAAMAGAAYAAAITWNSGTMYTLDESTGAFTSTKANASTGWQGYVWLIDQNTYESLAAKYASDKNFDAVINAYKGDIASADASGKITGRGTSISMDTEASAAGTYYGALLYQYGSTGNYVANLATVTLEESDGVVQNGSAGNLSAYAFGDDSNASGKITGGSTGASTPVVPDPDPVDGPEPTSALLLLIGGSMLALKRKNA